MNNTISQGVMREPVWAMRKEEVLQTLGSRIQGLSQEEVALRKSIFGPNLIEQGGRPSGFFVFVRQFRSPLVLILIAAFFITIGVGEWVNAAVIALAVLANTILGFWQENKAEHVLETLQTYVRARTKIRRNGKEQEIDAGELVPGDIILLSPGDRVSADGRIVVANRLEVDEAVITGESLPEEKAEEMLAVTTALPDRTSMVFGGTLVTEGFGEAVVVATGNATEFGKIARMIGGRRREETPLERAIAGFAKTSSIFLVVMVGGLFLLGILSGENVYDMFLIAVAVAVSAVPEGLPIALTVILAVGVLRLARRHGIVRKLLAAETLGSTSIILTDKTGTLTEAKMEVVGVMPHGDSSERAKAELVKKASCNTNVIIEDTDREAASWRFLGSPIEVALVRHMLVSGISSLATFRRREIIDRVPFSSQYKFSAVEIIYDGMRTAIVVGAPELLLSYTTLSEKEKKEIEENIKHAALRGERVVGVLEHPLQDNEHIYEDIKKIPFVFKGLIIFHDPLRPGVKAAIRAMRDAGVKTVIVTGDHPGTAETIARELGLVDGRGAVLTGDDLKYLSEDELYERASKVTVYARVTPEQKMMLVKLYQKQGEVVAVTGDGVNDAPALAQADIGVAVGSGTDVTKQAADLVVLDNNFETIVQAIFEGRKIVNNIRKVIVYLFSSVLDELFLIGGSLLFGLPLPLSALQILFVNFFSDSFPAVAFAFEDGIDDHSAKPSHIRRNILDPAMRVFIFVIGIGTSAFLFLVYAVLSTWGIAEMLVQSFIFASFSIYSLMLAFSLRSLEKNIFQFNPFSNFYLTGGVMIGVVLTLAVLYIPFLQDVFHTVSLPPLWLAGVFGMGIFNITLIEIAKYVMKKTRDFQFPAVW